MIKFSTLTTYSKHFKISQRDILHNWISQKEVYETLESHRITAEFFGRYFGKRMVEHTFGVISGKNELGSCLVIRVMLEFFKKKKFTIDEIFILCEELKNTTIQYTLKHKILSAALMAEITYLMDQNLRGVIRDLTDGSNALNSPSLTCSVSYKEEVFKNTEPTTISALQYLQEFEVDFELLDELNEIETEAITSINLEEVMTHETYGEVIKLLSNYIKVLDWLSEFKEIAFALNILIDILVHTPLESIDGEQLGIITIYIKAIISDLSMWRTSVFVFQNTHDIHYLDNTLLSSITQLKIMISEQESPDTCDIEFF